MSQRRSDLHMLLNFSICNGYAGPALDLGDLVSIAGHSGERLQLLCFLGLTG